MKGSVPKPPLSSNHGLDEEQEIANTVMRSTHLVYILKHRLDSGDYHVLDAASINQTKHISHYNCLIKDPFLACGHFHFVMKQLDSTHTCIYIYCRGLRLSHGVLH